MRICLITTAHNPDDDRIFFKEARSLVKKYRDVWIVSPHSCRIPLDKDGVKFISIADHPRTAAGRMKTMKDLFRAAVKLDADIYHCHEPESLFVALQLKDALACKVIFDSHEMYAATVAQRFPRYFHSPIMRLYRLFERRKISRCDFAIGATWGITEYLSDILGKEKTASIFNGSVADIFGEKFARVWGVTTLLCHDGTLTFDRGLKTMIQSVEIVSKRHPVRFRIVGDVYGAEKDWLESYISKRELNQVVERTGWLDYRDVGPAIGECHVGLIAFNDYPNHAIAAPNKLFNYLHFGLPVIVPTHCGGMKRMVEAEQCGLAADADSPAAYADALSYLIEHREEAAAMSANAKRISDGQYNWKVMESRLFDIYAKLAR